VVLFFHHMPKKAKAKVRGLFEKVPDSGIWWISFVDADGRYRREKVGRHSDAIKLRAVRISEALKGEKLPKNLRNRGFTFDDLSTNALAYSAIHHTDTRNVIQRLGTIQVTFGPRIASTIKPSEIDKWLSENTETPATANRYRATFSLVFKRAIHDGHLELNPTRSVTQRTEDNGVIRFLSVEELQRLTAAILGKFPEHIPELTISLKTGMRLSEQYTLTWGQVDLGAKPAIRLPRSKNGSGRTIPLNATALNAFKVLHAKAGDTSHDAPVFDIKRPRKWFETAIKDANVPNYTWHCNRHSFCTELAEKGATAKDIQDLAGHKTIAISARYIHLSDERRRTAINLIG